jgi:hypothetical protein
MVQLAQTLLFFVSLFLSATSKEGKTRLYTAYFIFAAVFTSQVILPTYYIIFLLTHAKKLEYAQSIYIPWALAIAVQSVIIIVFQYFL